MAFRTEANLKKEYGARKGLEGPFQFSTGHVFYYDPAEGKYYDPKSDFYVEQDQMDAIHAHLAGTLMQ